MVIIFGTNKGPSEPVKKLFQPGLIIGNGQPSKKESGFETTSGGILAPQSAGLILENNPQEIIVGEQNTQSGIQLSCDTQLATTRSFNRSELIEHLQDQVLLYLEGPDKNKAKLFFEHFSGTNDSLIADREFMETSHVFPSSNPRQGNQANKSQRALQEFDIDSAKLDFDNLVKFLFEVLEDRDPGRDRILKQNAIKILYHGLSYVQGYDWARHIESFSSLIGHPNTLVTGLSEQSLKVLYQHIDSRYLALDILKKLEKTNRLSGDLAQLLLFKFPDLKKEFTQFDFSAVPTTEILTDVDRYARLAANQIVNPSRSKGQVGIEIEMKLRGNDQYRSSETNIQQFINREFAYLANLGVDGAHLAAELRTFNKGFRLNSITHHDLLKLSSGLQAQPDLVYFATNHINVDSKEGLAFEDTLLSYRKDKGKYWESINNPPALFYVDKKTFPFCYEASVLIDQIKLHDELVQFSLQDLDLDQIEKLLTQDEKKLFFENFNLSQSSRVKILLSIAEDLKKPELVPVILRLYNAEALPSLNINLLVKDSQLNLAEIEDFLSNESINYRVRQAAAFRLMEVDLAAAEEFLGDERIDSLVRQAVTSRLAGVNLIVAEGLLKNKSVDFELRQTVASRLMELDLATAEGFLRDEKIDCRVREKVASRLAEVDLATAEGFLIDKSINFGLRHIVASRLTEVNLASIEKFLRSKDVDYRLKIEAVFSIGKLNFVEVKRLLVDQSIDPGLRQAIASRLTEVDLASVENFLRAGDINFGLKDIVASKLGKLSFAEAEGLLSDKSVDSGLRQIVASRLAEVKLKAIEGLLSDKNTDYRRRQALALKLNKLSFAEAESFLKNESIDLKVRQAVASRLTEVNFASIEKFLLDSSINSVLRQTVADSLTEANLEAVENFLRNGNIYYGINRAVASKLNKLGFAEAEKLLIDESVYYLVREEIARKITEIINQERLKPLLDKESINPYKSLFRILVDLSA